MAKNLNVGDTDPYSMGYWVHCERNTTLIALRWRGR